MTKYLKSIEPAALTGFLGTLWPLLIVLNIGLPVGAQEATMVAVPLVIAGVQALLVRPIKVPVMVNGAAAFLTAVAAWGVPIDTEVIPLLSATMLSLGGLLVSARVIPRDGVVDLEVVAAT